MISLCGSWEFTPEYSEEFASGSGEYEKVRLPHNAFEMPLHYGGPNNYEAVCGYRMTLTIDEQYKNKRLFLQFDGAAHYAQVYVNGTIACEHCCGYTAFRTEITDLVKEGDNLITVKLDSHESLNIPPFGYVIDYLTYSGLYREVWLDVKEQSYIEDVYVTTPDVNTACVKTTVSGEGTVKVFLVDGVDILGQADGESVTIKSDAVKPWSPESPKLYTIVATLYDKEKMIDEKRVTVGFRTAEFKNDGLYINGEKIFLRGLNRHQSIPYAGYAVPESLQREDARILQEELGCNAVRTSHYPQSHHFIDECDKRGLLVFTEFPGWQHIGDAQWQEQACRNAEEMVLQYRNHPSIVLWGVRINESQDNDEFYTKTNEIAHRLDPSRQTSGVRYITQSSLLEDVYAFNDFSHNGTTPGVLPKNKVTPDMNKPLLISEHDGHMFPTKSYDHWGKRQEQALRHARVINDAMADGQHAGCFGWCMFDYGTHKDFGSGDYVCYHGVTDLFRNPKTAAALYASQSDNQPVLEVGSSMNIGDYPAGAIGDFYVFTNADEVALYKNNNYVTSFKGSEYSALPHGPVKIDDLIGGMLETVEGFDKEKAARVKQGLRDVAKYGTDNLPLKAKLNILHCTKKYNMQYSEMYDLYSRYVANWGGESTVWRFEAIKDGKTVKTAVCCPGTKLHIEAKPSSLTLKDRGDTYDMAAVRIRILDENGNTANYAQLPVKITAEGPVELVGPDIVTAEGGMTGTYIKTTGLSGKAKLTFTAPNTEPAELEFEVLYTL